MFGGLELLGRLNGNALILFASRFARLFAFGCCGVILAVYVHEVEIPDQQLGLLLTLTVFGDSLISLVISLNADRVGRRLMLLVGAGLAVLGSSAFMIADGPDFFWVLVVAATIGVISPSGNDVGPFLALEQSILADLVAPEDRTMIFAWYGLLGYCASALGALSTGFMVIFLMKQMELSPISAYRAIFLEYAICALLVALLVLCLDANVEAHNVNYEGKNDDIESSAHITTTSTPKAWFSRPCNSNSSEEGVTRPLLLEVEHREESLDRIEKTALEAEEQEAKVDMNTWQRDPALEGKESTPLMVVSNKAGMSYGLIISSLSDHSLGSNAVLDHDSVSSVLIMKKGAGPSCSSSLGSELLHEEDVEQGAVDKSSRHMRKEDSASSLPALAAKEALGKSVRADEAGASAPKKNFQEGKKILGLSPDSLRTVMLLSVLFAADAFGASLVTGTLMAYYFQVRFSMPISYLGGILFMSYITAGLSSLLSGPISNRFGLVNTMVFTHLPSNVFLLLVPLMPNVQLATLFVFLRSCTGQMDVVPRQSYVSGVVPPHERTATMGITNVVRSLGAACGPLLTGYLAQHQLFGYAFYLSGGIMIAYDLALLACFRSLKADHEKLYVPGSK